MFILAEYDKFDVEGAEDKRHRLPALPEVPTFRPHRTVLFFDSRRVVHPARERRSVRVVNSLHTTRKSSMGQAHSQKRRRQMANLCHVFRSCHGDSWSFESHTIAAAFCGLSSGLFIFVAWKLRNHFSPYIRHLPAIRLRECHENQRMRYRMQRHKHERYWKRHFKK